MPRSVKGSFAAEDTPLTGSPENAVLRYYQRRGGEWIIYTRYGRVLVGNDSFCHQMHVHAMTLHGEHYKAADLTRQQHMRIRRAAAQGLAEQAGRAAQEVQRGR